MTRARRRRRPGARLRDVAIGLLLVAVAGCDAGRDPADGEPPAATLEGIPPSEDASSSARVAIETSRGAFVIEVHRDWAPEGARRFLHLVGTGYYDDARFHRVVPDFIVQWGLAGDPALTAEWMHHYIPDDSVRSSNTRGRVAFAFTDPGTRSTQVYINLVDNVRLDSVGFAPFGEVIEGMEVVDALYSEYGETSGGGLRRGDQSRIVADGNLYLDREFPLLARLIRARIDPRD